MAAKKRGGKKRGGKKAAKKKRKKKRRASFTTKGIAWPEAKKPLIIILK